MAGFVWHYNKDLIAPKQWILSISTVRRRYAETFWDEELTAIYLNGAHAGEKVPTYRDTPSENREVVLFVCDLQEGDIVQIKKNDRIARYNLIVGEETHILADDFAEPVQRYLNGVIDVWGLLAEENAKEFL